MPTFDTPHPITAFVDIARGDVRIATGERDTTVVTVEPTDATSAEDRKAAELTRVELADGRLLVKAPKLRSWLPRASGGSIALTIELPDGSNLNGDGALADFACDGRFGECRIKTGLGRIRVDEAQTVHLRTGLGDITLGHASGHAEVVAGSGEVRVRELDASAVIKNSNGDSWVGVANGHLRLSAANGDIAIDRSQATVGAKSSNGDVRVGRAVRGSVVLETRLGDVEVGIPEGTAAWLDVRAGAGRVRNALDAAEAPGDATDKVEVRARTTAGDVVIRRP